MGSDGLLATIQSRQLRMNALSKMNDPREALEWAWSGPLPVTDGYTEAQIKKRLNHVLRRSTRVMSMTADRMPAAGADPASLFHRGWGRAPMWAHYAQDHFGVCLVLAPHEVAYALHEYVPIGDGRGRYSTHGHVAYVDKPIDIPLMGPFPNQAALDSALDAILGTRWNISGLHMTKNTDWSNETELRIAAVDLHLEEHELDTPMFVPLGNCLKAVVFGHLHPSPEAAAQECVATLGADSPEFFQCHWEHGAPTLEPLPI